MTEFRRTARAITKAGQIKGERRRHEKDDRSRIDDRSPYVLGWSNERKLEALLGGPGSRRHSLTSRRRAGKAPEALDAAVERRPGARRARRDHEFAEIDWQSLVNRTEELRAEKRELEAASAELARLTRELSRSRSRSLAPKARSGEDGRLGGARQPDHARRGRMHEVRRGAGRAGCEPARAHFATIAALLQAVEPAPAGHPAPATAPRGGRAEISTLVVTRRTRVAAALGNKIVAAMGEFRSQYPVETEELDDGGGVRGRLPGAEPAADR